MKLALLVAAVAGTWPLATIPSVGTVSWSCDRHDRYALVFHAFADSATDEVTYRGVTHTVQPGQTLRFPYSRTLHRRIAFLQGIEPGTLRAAVDVDFSARSALPSHCEPYLPPGVTVHVSPR